jgi:AAA domain, putative AbiEii toxin, Type IV TA system/AAA domain
MITSLELHQFRGFADLKLDGLKRVNLIVGKNNAGKTALLEGLAIGCDAKKNWDKLPTLFRPSIGDVHRRSYAWLIREGESEHALIRLHLGETSILTRLFPHTHDPKKAHPDNVCVINTDLVSIERSKNAPTIACRAMPVRPLDPEEILHAYSTAALQSGGEELIDAVANKMDPRVRKIRQHKLDDGNILFADIGLRQLLPLTQAGQGLYRLVSMLSGVFGGRPQVALLDEVDDGLHHSVLPDVWRGIAEAAELFDVQVFATTHSAECIEAAHEAYLDRAAYDFSVIQLYRVQDAVQGRVLGKDEISTGIDHNIDLR